MVDAVADGAVRDHLLCKGDGRDAAVIVADHIDDARFFDGGDHFPSLQGVEGEGFLAEDGLAVLRGGDGDFGMGIVGGADVDDVDFGIGDDGAPVGRSVFPAEAGAGFFDGGGGAAADGVEADGGWEIKETGSLAPCV